MTLVPTLIAGALCAFALSARPSPAYRRVVARRAGSPWRTGLTAAWPGLALDVGGLGLAALGLLLWQPETLTEEAILVAPLVLFLLIRGWKQVETPGTSFVHDLPDDGPPAPEVLKKPFKSPWRLAVRLAVSAPAAWSVGKGGALALTLFIASYALVSVGMPVLVAWTLARRRAPRPYVVMPETARMVMATAALVLFVSAFGIIAALVIEHGAVT